MSKNRKLTFLLILVSAVWGGVGYRIYAHFKPEPVSFVKKPLRIIADTTEIVKHDLKLSYTDPFLKKISKSTGDQKKRKVLNRRIEPAAPTFPIAWEIVHYQGIVFNASRKHKIALLKIGDNDHFLKVGDEADGFLVEEILDDSIKVKFNNVFRFIKRENY